MYALVTQLRYRAAVVTEAVCFSAAMITAEFFFKFHSFILECTAFLALWFCLGAAASAVVARREEESAV